MKIKPRALDHENHMATNQNQYQFNTRAFLFTVTSYEKTKKEALKL